MPSVRIVTGVWARGRELELLEAVQSAMLKSIKIPEWDRDGVVDVYDEARRIVPSGNSECYTRVEIELLAGRSIEAKRTLFGAIVANLGEIGVPPTEIRTILIEVPPENCAIRGGHPASEVDLGFKVGV